MTDDLLSRFVELESSVWRALVDGDPGADRSLLAEDFRGVYPTGFADRADHVGQLAGGPTVTEFAILSPALQLLGDDHVLLSYEAHYRRSSDADVERMYVSSLWSNRGGTWLNVFSQDTPAIE